MSDWYCHPPARQWADPATPPDVRTFHRSLPGYAPTPLVSLPGLAALGLTDSSAVVLLSTEAAR